MTRARPPHWPLFLFASLAIGGTPPPIPAIEAPTHLHQLRDPTLDHAVRIEAAQRILSSPDAVGTLAPVLESGVHSLPVVFEAMSSRHDLDPAFAPHLIRAMASNDPELRVLAIQAAAVCRDRTVAIALVDLLRADAPIGPSAARSLRRLTGLEHASQDEWTIWLDAAWPGAIFEGLGSRADELSVQNRLLEERVLAAYRRLHLLTPQEERSALLASFLLDPLPQVRSLGFDLVARELAGARRLNGEVAESALQLLGHADARVRADAAVLVHQLAPAGAGPRVVLALREESDPNAARALLSAVTRWPSDDATLAILEWLQGSQTTRIDALNALWSMARDGHLPPADHDRVLDVLRRIDQWTPSSIRLIGMLGNEEDRNALVPLMTGEDPALRVAAATALVPEASYLDAIIAAAMADQALFDACATAISTHRTSLEGYQTLTTLPARDLGRKRAAILRFSEGLSTSDLVGAARTVVDDAEFQVDLLKRLTTSEPSDEALDGRLLLATSALTASNPALTIEALAPLESGDERDAMLVVAFVRTQQTDEACTFPLEAWHGAIDRVGAEEKQTLARLALEHFDELDETQRERLASHIENEPPPH